MGKGDLWTFTFVSHSSNIFFFVNYLFCFSPLMAIGKRCPCLYLNPWVFSFFFFPDLLKTGGETLDEWEFGH